MVSIPLATLAGSVLHMDILWVYLAMSCEHVVKCGLGYPAPALGQVGP